MTTNPTTTPRAEALLQRRARTAAFHGFPIAAIYSREFHSQSPGDYFGAQLRMALATASNTTAHEAKLAAELQPTTK